MKMNENGFIDIEVKELYEWHGSNGEGCMVSDKITKEGWKVGYMYREEPMAGCPDSGWRFLKGDESDDYLDDPDNCHIFAINTVCNYDPDIIPYMGAEVGCCYIRVSSSEFELDNGDKPIFFEKQDSFEK